MILAFVIILILILIVLVRCIVIVPQSNAYVVEWLGVYKDTWGAGLHLRVRLWNGSPAAFPSRKKPRISSPSPSSPATTSP